MRSFDAESHIVNIAIGEFAMDDGVPYIPKESISEEVLSLRVAESALLIVWWDWGKRSLRETAFFSYWNRSMSAFCQGPICFSMTRSCLDTPNCICHRQDTEPAHGKQEADLLVCVPRLRRD